MLQLVAGIHKYPAQLSIAQLQCAWRAQRARAPSIVRSKCQIGVMTGNQPQCHTKQYGRVTRYLSSYALRGGTLRSFMQAVCG